MGKDEVSAVWDAAVIVRLVVWVVGAVREPPLRVGRRVAHHSTFAGVTEAGMTRPCATDINATTHSHDNPSFPSFQIIRIIVQKPPPAPVIPAHAGIQGKAKPTTFLPFAPRRGRVQSTQGMHEIQRSITIKQQPPRATTLRAGPRVLIPCIPLRLAKLNASPFAKRRGGHTSPSSSEGDACKARRGCTKFNAAPPSNNNRHSRLRN